MIKNVLFDLGGILITFQPKREIRKLGLSPSKSEEVYQAIFQDPLWADADKGMYAGVSETLPLYLKKYPHLKKEILQFFHPHWEDMFSMIPEGKAFYEKVRKSGYGCYILSNYPREGFAYTENRYTSFFSNTDGMVISGRVHMAKPDEAIFQYLLDTYALKKEECVFFDDTKGNVDAANAFGIRSFVYTDPDTAWSDLQSLC